MLFAITLFIGAFLLFQVQPFIANAILPWFGGGASVWTACMLVFQTLLLLGYGYAYLLSAFRLSTQRNVHVGLIVIACICLPFGTPSMQGLGQGDPTINIILVLISSIGLPFILLSSTGPLVQSWYALTYQNKTPYTLYSVSNIASGAALLSYPFVVEPWVSLQQQGQIWSLTFVLFGTLLAALLWKVSRTHHSASGVTNEEVMPKPSRLHRCLWVSLSALGVSLLVATTNAMTQNVTPVPFLWILPLFLYLISFVLVFASPRWYPRAFWLAMFCLTAIAAILITFVAAQFDLLTQILLFNLVLFSGCMVCHGEMVRLVPHKQFLTLFYLLVSFGGVLGSVFVSLLAPHWFVQFTEYPLTLMGILLISALCIWLDTERVKVKRIASLSIAIMAGLMALGYFMLDASYRAQHVANHRNFYGLLSVVDVQQGALHQRRLIDGTTSHGSQSLLPGESGKVMSYYRPETGGALALNYYHTNQQRELQKAGIIGLGAGAMAAYGKSGQTFTFYEINPAVIDFAQRYFSFLSDSAAQIQIHQGDGRLLLQHALEQRSEAFDVLIVDAFSGDAIPRHLLTAEAFELYLRHVSEQGVLALHLSNNYLDLTALVRNQARRLGMQAYYFHTPVTQNDSHAAQWVLITRNQDFIQQPEVRAYLSPWPDSRDPDVIWWDDYSNLLSVLK